MHQILSFAVVLEAEIEDQSLILNFDSELKAKNLKVQIRLKDSATGI